MIVRSSLIAVASLPTVNWNGWVLAKIRTAISGLVFHNSCFERENGCQAQFILKRAAR